MKSKNSSNKILALIKSQGFNKIELDSVLETKYILQRSGENFRKYLFSFYNSNGEELCLRPDLTISSVLRYAQGNRFNKEKVFYTGSAFRKSYNKKNILIKQIGMEIFSSKDENKDDKEIIDTSIKVLKKTGFKKAKVEIGNFKLFELLIQKLSIPQRWKDRLIKFYWNKEYFSQLLKRLDSNVLTSHLSEILKREGLSAEEEALQTISREAAGSVRDALSILDQVLVNCETKIENQMVNELLGKISKSETLYLIELIIEGKTKEALKKVREYISGNTSPALLLQELLECLHFISVSSLMDNELIGDDYSLEEKKLAEKLSSVTDMVILTSLWQILFKGIDELRVAAEPITSLEMLLLRACHMSIMPSPDALIKSVLNNGSDKIMDVYNLERKSALKTPEKGGIIQQSESKIENSETQKSEESLENSAVKEILDIFPGATVKK